MSPLITVAQIPSVGKCPKNLITAPNLNVNMVIKTSNCINAHTTRFMLYVCSSWAYGTKWKSILWFLRLATNALLPRSNLVTPTRSPLTHVRSIVCKYLLKRVSNLFVVNNLWYLFSVKIHFSSTSNDNGYTGYASIVAPGQFTVEYPGLPFQCKYGA